MAVLDDFRIRYDIQKIEHFSGTSVYTVNQLYTAVLQAFDDFGGMDDLIPISAQTPNEYTLINGWFIDDESCKYLKTGAIQTSGWTHPANTTGIRVLTLNAAANLTSDDIGKVVTDSIDTGKLLAYDTTLKKLWVRCDGADDLFDDNDAAVTVDGQACGNMANAISVTGETIYSNIFTLGTLVSGTIMDVYQNDAQITPQWWTSGHIDILVKVMEADVETDSGNITILARKYSTLYDHYVIDASTGRNPVPLAAFADGNNETAEGTVGAYTGITFDFGASSHDVDGNTINEPYDVEINCGGLYLTQVYEYLKYVTRTGSAITFTGYGTTITGEYYQAVGDIRLAYDNEGGGGTAFDELTGELITGTGGGTPTGYLVSLIDDGTTGIMVLRNVHGTFTNDQVITGGTSGRTAQVNGTPDSIAQSKQAPFGTFAGGKFFGARGVYISNMHADDANNYELLDSTNTPRTPPATVSISATVTDSSGNAVEGAQVYIQKSAPGKSWNYTSHNTNNVAGGSTFEVNEVVDIDIHQTGWLHIWDASSNSKQNYRYASWTGKIFTLPPEVAGTANTDGTTTTLKRKDGTSFLTADIEEGDTVINASYGSWAVVDEIVDADTITTTALSSGSWDENDAYSFHRLAIPYLNTDLIDIPIYNGQTNASGQISTSYNYSAYNVVLPIIVRVRSNEGTPKFVPYNTSGTVTTSGSASTVVLTEDTVAAVV